MRGVAAAITAGGASRRFGSDKALYVYRGRTLLDHVAASLGEHQPRLLVAPAGRYSLPGWQQVDDTRPGEGPLAGLEAALGAAPPGWLAFSAVDLPHLTPGYWQRLHEAARSDVQAVYGLDASGRPQPLAALYHREALPIVSGLLDSGERRMRVLLDHLAHVALPWQALAPLAADLYQNFNRSPDSP